MKSRKYHSFLLKFFFLALSCILLSSGSAAAQTLYGAADPDNNDVSDLYSIDPANGDAMLIGPIGFRGVTGLAFLPDGRLIGSARSPNTTSGGIIIFHAILIEIDPTTGAGNLIGEIDTSEDGCGRIPDISFDRTKNTLFGVGSTNGCASRSHLYTIDPQAGGGGIPLANATGFDGTGNGLAVHPQTGIVYHTPSD
ncbi:MAG TPA: hypothetical protein DF383_11185, partial [Deltaproteobacteria bacterium]|nr:hypothetical protein [Deltaproteobacteria bacterium]